MNPPNAGDSVELSRRSFLGWAAAGLTSMIGALLGAVGGGYFLSPLFQKSEENWVDVGAAKDIRPGVPVKIEFSARKRDAWVVTETRSSAWVLTSNGRDFVVFDPRCTHLGCPYRWDDQEKQFLCPCHTAVFDVDGRVVKGPPPRPLDRYAAKVAGGRLMILPQAVKEHA